MLSYNIDSIESAEKLIKICEKYKGKMDIDVICRRQIIDAFSILGVHSLIGNIVTLDLLTDDKKLREKFMNDLEKINANKN